jgi:hypothetical protein
MGTNNAGELRSLVNAIGGRIADKTVEITASFKPHVKIFLAIIGRFEAAAAAADEAEAARSKALGDIGDADDGLDEAVDAFANAVSAAELGPRMTPFAPFSKLSVSAIKALPYATEPTEVRKLVAAVAKKKPPKPVVKAGNVCLARAAAVDKAVRAYRGPKAAHTKAIAARDELLPEVVKALKTFKAHAGSAFAATPSALKALFAPPSAVEAPKKRRASKKAAAKANGAEPAGPAAKAGAKGNGAAISPA